MKSTSIYSQNQNMFDVNQNNKPYLIGLLNQKIAEHLKKASAHIKNKELDKKHIFIEKALKIIDEGLLNCLDEKNGGDVAKNLKDFYLSSSIVITQANLKNNTQDLEKIADCYNEMQKSWLEISIQIKN